MFLFRCRNVLCKKSRQEVSKHSLTVSACAPVIFGVDHVKPLSVIQSSPNQLIFPVAACETTYLTCSTQLPIHYQHQQLAAIKAAAEYLTALEGKKTNKSN